MRNRRHGASLIELILVLGIIFLLTGLVLGAVQKARLQASKQVAMNKIKQVLLATHHYASINNDTLPNTLGEPPSRGSVADALGPYLDPSATSLQGSISWWRLSSDPSLSLSPQSTGAPAPFGLTDHIANVTSSLAMNPMVYATNTKLSVSFPDGQSNTIAITEHYGICGPTTFEWSLVTVICADGPLNKRVPCVGASGHRATFADTGFDDIVPVTTVRDSVATSVGSRAVTFQVRPPLSACDPRVPQSSFPGGILVGLVDGSVRFIPSSIDHSIFWGAVTPDRGEIVALD